MDTFWFLRWTFALCMVRDAQINRLRPLSVYEVDFLVPEWGMIHAQAMHMLAMEAS